MDCSAESPNGRRSVCYDHYALEKRKENKPKNSAVNMADVMGIDILTEEQYCELQKLGNFDTKTSSWIITPSDIRKLGVLFLRIIVIAKISCITMVQNLIMHPEGFLAR